MDEVDIFHAYSWYCPRCDKKVFFEPEEHMDVTDTEKGEEEIRKFLDLSDWQSIPEDHDLVIYELPEVVTCPDCGTSFAGRYEDDGDYDEED